MKTQKQQSIFEKFTNLYSLSKTLRFELKPVGNTLNKMKENIGYDENIHTFLKDQEIEDAYQILKPIFDFLHERFITESLESNEAKKLTFGDYFDLYEKQKTEQNKNDKKIRFDKQLEVEGERLRKKFEKIYEAEGNRLKNKVGKDKKGSDILKESSFKILTEAGILKYIKNNIKEFASKKLVNYRGQEITRKDVEKALGTENTRGIFEGFFTYFGGFNQNRENYYSTEEKATAVASRIVDENLPKFCDNIIIFKNKKNDYLNAYTFLKKQNIVLADKDGNDLHTISESIFTIKHFAECLSQIQIDGYNKHIGNANFVVNLYNQQKSKNDFSFKKLPIFKILYKQIGCGDKKQFIAEIKNNDELKKVLEEACAAGKKYFTNKRNDSGEILNVYDFMNYIHNHENYKGVYWSDKALNTVSSKYFANWFTLKTELKKSKIFGGKVSDPDDIAIPKAIELADLFSVLDNESINRGWKEAGMLFKVGLFEKDNETKKGIILKEKKPSQALLGMIFEDIKQNVRSFLANYEDVLNLANFKDDKNKQKIKAWLDNALWINQILKYFQVKPNNIKGSIIDAKVEHGLKTLVYADDNPCHDYDVVRNFLTKKPQDDLMDNKLKLNFENSTLAGGWDINKEPNNYCVIFKNGDKRYLAIITKQKEKGYNKIFEKTLSNPLYQIGQGECWQKMNYKLLPGPNKMLPKVFFSKKWIDNKPTPAEINRIYSKGSFKKGDNFNKGDLRKLIDFFKFSIKENLDWNCFNFSFKDTDEYEGIEKFYNDVEKQGYLLDFSEVNKSVIDTWVSKGKVYLFEIRNQDSNDSKVIGHKNNLHTMYWNEVFGNGENKPKLNGEAEIFYRPAFDKNKLNKKKDKRGKEIIDGYRFSKEKFIFHCPITLNFCLKNHRVNDELNECIKNHNDIRFLGIDRGEKHLAYYSLVNQKGEILEQGSFNEINGQNYAEKLDKLAGDRDEARKNWTTIGTIKELKDGYISQVVRKIVDLAIYKNVKTRELRESPAFIVLEDLNIGFKRGRQKIEKQVYQKLELALAKKLNFLVDKEAKNGEIGSVTKAIQLTPPVNNFGDMEHRKQLGNMLYIRADYTSQIDPVTGWRKTIYLKSGSEQNIKEQIRNSFKDIGYEKGDYYFEYETDLLDPINKNSNIKKVWKLYSGKNGVNLDRFHRERNSDKNVWISEKQDIKNLLNVLFRDFDKKKSLYRQIFEEEKQLVKLPKEINKKDKPAWESLRFIINLIQQIRNSGESTEDDDFILSPARDQNGEHFDSRKAKDNLPVNGDANGAYNIARKGIIATEHIRRGFGKLYINDAEWSAWLAGREIWEKWVEKNKKDLVKDNK